VSHPGDTLACPFPGLSTNRILTLVLAGVVGWTEARGDGNKPSPSVSRLRLEANVRFLADDQLDGRATPSRGLDLAALYIEKELRGAGWQPGNGASQLQPYEIHTFAPLEAKRVVRINGAALDPGEYNLITGEPSAVVERHDVLYAGYGIGSPERPRRPQRRRREREGCLDAVRRAVATRSERHSRLRPRRREGDPARHPRREPDDLRQPRAGLAEGQAGEPGVGAHQKPRDSGLLPAARERSDGAAGV